MEEGKRAEKTEIRACRTGPQDTTAGAVPLIPEKTEENIPNAVQPMQTRKSPHEDFVHGHLIVRRLGLTEPKGMKL